MEEKEYLQTLGEQILNPHARTHVLEEIQEHIDEQMQDYIDTGMSPVSGCFVRHCGGSYIIRNFHAIYPVWF